MMAQPQKMTGTIKGLNPTKGFGFILCESDGLEYFFHRSAAADFDILERGMAVRFVPTAGQKGPRADQVEML